MLLDQSLRSRVVLSFLVVALASAGVCMVAYRGMRELSGLLDGSSEQLVPSLIALDVINEGLSSVRSNTWRSVVHLHDGNAPKVREGAQVRELIYTRIREGERSFAALPHPPEVQALWRRYLEQEQRFEAVNGHLWEGILALDAARVRERAAEQSRTLDATRASVTELLALQHRLAEAGRQEGQEAQARALRLLVGAGVGALVLALVLALLIHNSIVRPVRHLSRAAAAIAQGNLEQRIAYHSRDELGQLADAFRSLVRYVREVADASEALSRGELDHPLRPRSEADLLGHTFLKATAALRGVLAETQRLIAAAEGGALAERGEAARFPGAYAQLVEGTNRMLDAVQQPTAEAADALDRLAARDLTVRMHGDYRGDYERMKHAFNTAAQQLQAGLVQVASTAAELSTASERIVATGQAAAQLAQGARATSGEGMEAMSQLLGAMDRIQLSSQGTAAVINDIDELATETGFLSVNAALQAATAGEAARGFAVVAREVQQLAHRSRQAAQRTESLIRDSVKSAHQGGELSAQVHQNLARIAEAITRMDGLIGELAATGSAEAAAPAGEGGAARLSAAQQLARQADAMGALVGQFRLGLRD